MAEKYLAKDQAVKCSFCGFRIVNRKRHQTLCKPCYAYIQEGKRVCFVAGKILHTIQTWGYYERDTTDTRKGGVLSERVMKIKGIVVPVTVKRYSVKGLSQEEILRRLHLKVAFDIVYKKTKCGCGRRHRWKFVERVWSGKYLQVEFHPKRLWKYPVPEVVIYPDYLADLPSADRKAMGPGFGQSGYKKTTV